jgi:peptidoglycan/LPS O-acetylase OafA/YrhL
VNDVGARSSTAFRAPSLDGVRAIAFLLVFVAHAGLQRVVPGGFGVTVFFFLSGYLITTLLRLEDDSTGTVGLGAFYLRRAFRILPPFYLVLGAAALLAWLGVLPGSVDRRAVAAQALHLANYWIVSHGYQGEPSGTGVYWSLAVEEHFYLVFPLLYLLTRRLFRERRQQAFALLGLCGAMLLWRILLVYGAHVSTDRTYVASDTRADSILFGCALALFENPALGERSRLRDQTWKHVMLPLSALVLLFTFVYRDPSFRETFRYSLQGLALAPFFVVVVRFPDWGLVRLLNTRVMAFAGVLSYALYLVHHVVLDALSTIIDLALPRAILGLLISVALALLIHRFVEKPAAALRKRMSTPVRAAALPTPALSGAREP